MDNEQIRKIWDVAIEAKRQGKYDEAIKLYKKALELDPTEVMTYYGLGKVYFLLGNKDESIKNYLIACHLSLKNIKKHLNEDSETNKMLKFLMYQLSQEVKESFSKIHPVAPFLLLDNNTPRHIGYSIILLDENEAKSRDILRSGKQYRLALTGKKATLNEYIEMTVFQPRGIIFLLENIIWNKLEVENPAPLYDYYKIYRLVRNIVKKVEELSGLQVYEYDVIDFTSKDDIEWSMGWGIGLQKPNDRFNQLFVCYIALEIDHWDYIVTPTHRTLTEDEVKRNIEQGMGYFQATSSGNSISDWQFQEFLEDLLKTNIVPIGAIKSEGRKYRTFKWLTAT